MWRAFLYFLILASILQIGLHAQQSGGWRRVKPAERNTSKPTDYVATPANAQPVEALPVPKGWSVRDGQSMVIVEPDSAAGDKQLRVEVYNPEQADGELSAWLIAALRKLNLEAIDPAACKPKLRGEVEASCVVRTNHTDELLYALKISDGRYRFVRVSAARSGTALLDNLRPVQQIVKNAGTGAGQSGSNRVAVAPTGAPTEKQQKNEEPQAAASADEEAAATAAIEAMTTQSSQGNASQPATPQQPQTTAAVETGGHLPGLSWPPPNGFARAENEEDVCPWACVSYKGPFISRRAGRGDPSPNFWPLLIVEEARVADASQTLEQLVAAIKSLPKMQILERRPAESTDGSFSPAAAALLRTKNKSNREIWRYIAVVQKGKVSVPFEVASFDNTVPINGRLPALAKLAESIQVNQGELSKATATVQAEFGGGPDAAARIYTVGERGTTMVNGLAMVNIEWQYLTLLSDGAACYCLPPGGVDRKASTRLPVKDAGRWTNNGGSIHVEFPRKSAAEDRSWDLIAVGEDLNWKTGKPPGSLTGNWRRVPPLTPDTLAGAWQRSSIQTPSMGTFPGQIMTAVSNTSKFRFDSSGQYVGGDQTSVSVGGDGVGGGSNRKSGDAGTWRLEGYTLILAGSKGEERMTAVDQKDQHVVWVNLDGRIFERAK